MPILPSSNDFLTPPADLAQVFVTHRKQLTRAAQDIVGSTENAEDLVQDACLMALQSVRTTVVDHPLAYAHRCVRNLAIDRYRRASLESRLFDTDDSAEHVASTGASPEAAVSVRQQVSLLMSALAALPARARKALELYRVEGMTQREIAAEFSVSPTLVNFMIHDALATCRAALTPD